MWLETRIVLPCVGQPQQQLVDLAPPAGIDARQRLVQQQQPGIVHQRLGQLDPLPHAVAAAGQPPAGPIGHADFLEHVFGCALPSLGAR